MQDLVPMSQVVVAQLLLATSEYHGITDQRRLARNDQKVLGGPVSYGFSAPKNPCVWYSFWRLNSIIILQTDPPVIFLLGFGVYMHFLGHPV